jgi:hypothetical protein
MLGESNRMKLDVDPLPVNAIDFSEKKVLVRSDQATTTKGKNVVISDELRRRRIKPRSPEIGRWKENTTRKPMGRVKPMCNMLVDKYT